MDNFSDTLGKFHKIFQANMIYFYLGQFKISRRKKNQQTFYENLKYRRTFRSLFSGKFEKVQKYLRK